MTDEILDKLRWIRNRRWLDQEIETYSRSDEDYARGYVIALMKVQARMFLTAEEQSAVARAHVEMFG